ncbi:hypothetical protein [Massilia brevitalea]|uniref:hypothetical protein n=1 Tax=Massilia brevitalea TaxID=442526 RepID=UPI002739AD50|nr:hypothetical protein [Massilia brevitalea]
MWQSHPDVNDVPAHWSRNRRDSLRILGSGAALAALGPLAACSSGHAASRSDELRDQLLADERFWADVAGMFTLDPARRFLNVGTAGSMPKVALDMFDSENRTKARESGNGYTNLLAERTEVAPGFGVDPDELAFSANTSSGMCHAILGLGWQPGDVIVTTINFPVIGAASDHYAIRISTHLWTGVEDIDRLVGAMADLAGKMG